MPSADSRSEGEGLAQRLEKRAVPAYSGPERIRIGSHLGAGSMDDRKSGYTENERLYNLNPAHLSHPRRQQMRY